MNALKNLFLCALCLLNVNVFAHSLPKQSEQLIVVRTPSWNSVSGKCQAYKKSLRTGKWIPTTKIMDIVVGKNGLGWGRGLHSLEGREGPYKQEGDLKGPAGLFYFGTAFGKKPLSVLEEQKPLRMPYVQIIPTLEAVDDPSSKYYNQIVDRNKIADVDWASSEKMHAIDLYEIGLEILHNFPVQNKEAGSAIYVHLWRGIGRGTAGCLAMCLEDMESLFYWIDETKHPLLVQLPEEEFERLQTSWQLPDFIESALDA